MVDGDLIIDLLAQAARWTIAGAMGAFYVEMTQDGFLAAFIGAIPLLLAGMFAEYFIRLAENSSSTPD